MKVIFIGPRGKMGRLITQSVAKKRSDAGCCHCTKRSGLYRRRSCYHSLRVGNILSSHTVFSVEWANVWKLPIIPTTGNALQMVPATAQFTLPVKILDSIRSRMFCTWIKIHTKKELATLFIVPPVPYLLNNFRL